MIYLVTANSNLYCYKLLDTTLVMTYEYKAYRVIIHEQGIRSPVAGGPHRCAYQERLGGHQANYPRL